MAATLVLESTLTDRYQTTVPDGVRRALHLGRRDRIRYLIQPNGSVRMERAQPDSDDPAIGAFLDFLEADMLAHPERVRPLTADFAKRVKALVKGVEVKLDQALDPDDE